MLYRIGTRRELASLVDRLPPGIRRKLLHCLSVLDRAYGAERDYLESGGYALVAESEADLWQLQKTIDLETEPCEWITLLEGNHLCALHLPGDDFAILVFMPVEIAPVTMLKQLKGEC